MADISPELYTIRRIGDKDPEAQRFYAKDLVKSKLTPESNLKFRVLEEQTIAKKKSLYSSLKESQKKNGSIIDPFDLNKRYFFTHSFEIILLPPKSAPL